MFFLFVQFFFPPFCQRALVFYFVAVVTDDAVVTADAVIIITVVVEVIVFIVDAATVVIVATLHYGNGTHVESIFLSFFGSNFGLDQFCFF